MVAEEPDAVMDSAALAMRALAMLVETLPPAVVKDPPAYKWCRGAIKTGQRRAIKTGIMGWSHCQVGQFL